MRNGRQIEDQLARLETARAAMVPDRRVLAEIDVQISFLRFRSWTAKIPDQVMACELAERWLDGESDTEPASHWEHLAALWKHERERKPKLALWQAGLAAV